jgi:hypothetical protein
MSAPRAGETVTWLLVAAALWAVGQGGVLEVRPCARGGRGAVPAPSTAVPQAPIPYAYMVPGGVQAGVFTSLYQPPPHQDNYIVSVVTSQFEGDLSVGGKGPPPRAPGLHRPRCASMHGH